MLGWQTRTRNESEGSLVDLRWDPALAGWRTIDRSHFRMRFEYELLCWDPKDGELCLCRVKPGETLVEARSDSDVQIDRQIWV